jgi:hypothetical protein
MMAHDLTAKTFGWLTAKEPTKHHGVRAWICVCRCGKTTIVPTRDLNSKKSQSCGCKKLTQGGKSHTRTFQAWSNMIRRCTNPRDREYRNYGGRGIAVHPDWREFENFLADMGERPAGLTLERMENEEGYGPLNCKWATRHDQQRNMRVNHMINYAGETLCLSDWAKKLGMKRATLSQRFRRGWSIERALNTL